VTGAETQTQKVPDILIVDDEVQVRGILSQILEMDGYACATAGDASEARRYLERGSFKLILCDINMPGESGIEFIRDVVREFPETATVMVTVMDDPMIADNALDIGVYDYIIKPFESNSVLISVANALRRRQLEIDNRKYSEQLEKMVADRTAALEESMRKLRKALEGSVQAMARTVETRDPYTAGHQQRVADLATAIAGEMGFSEDHVAGIRMAGQIHDLGKISVPAEILSKSGPISDIEFSLIKAHPKGGYDILSSIEFPWPIALMVLQHHERMDGSGYPSGLTGDRILMEARILGVADVVEAMASHRPYRPALGIEKAMEEIRSQKDRLYDPEVVEVCLRLFESHRFSFD